MKIFMPIFQNNTYKQSSPRRYPNLQPLKYDTVSFGAMKKNQFEGIDYGCVEKYKPPIEKFNDNQDLQNWALSNLNKIVDKDFKGRRLETRTQRKEMLKEWSNYIINENDTYTPVICYMIMAGITKDLKVDNDKLPPVLNKGILADTVFEIDKNIKENKKYSFDLNKMYQKKIQESFFETDETNNNITQWVVIPSKNQDRENFPENVNKLKQLSHKNWCTKSFNAEPYLSEGEFHVYLENGKPKIGIRFIGDKVEEIQGEKNNGQIPNKYLDITKEYIATKSLETNDKTKREIKKAEELRVEFNKIHQELDKAIESNDVAKILNHFGYNATEDENHNVTISHYNQPSPDYTFQDLGINENNLFKKITRIKGNANFGNSILTDLGKLEVIEGNANFNHSQIKRMDNLKEVKGNATFQNSKLTSLYNLKSICGMADFEKSNLEDLGELEFIGSSAFFENSKIKSLNKLKVINQHLFLPNSNIEDLGALEYIGGNANLYNSKVKDLKNLKYIGGSALIMNSNLTPEDFKNITVGKNIVTSNTK